MFYNNLKKFLTRCNHRFLILSRLKDVLMMMILFHVWPEQTYRFSTRKTLPGKKNRFSIKSKQVFPYDLLKSKSTNMPAMEEINVVGIGPSFDLNNLKDLKGPIFHPGWGPLRIDNNGKVFYKHLYSYEKEIFRDAEELFNDEVNKDLKNVTYVNPRRKAIELFKKNDNKVLAVVTYGADKDGNHYPHNKEWETLSYLNLFDHDQCKRIAIVEKFYQPSLQAQSFVPTKSLLPSLCALSFFAKKINVYGWDFYLDSSPENMSYWQLFFKMYSYKNDIRCVYQFESALINFYYGYQLSKLSNIKIHGYMGQLGKHHKLIRRIEKVLFNHK